jgi:hypothetical protein
VSQQELLHVSDLMSQPAPSLFPLLLLLLFLWMQLPSGWQSCLRC